MKVYISCDLEGISGVVSPEHAWYGGKDFEMYRRLMTGEVNAAVEGALEGGATDVVVNDAHGPMTNILIEELNPNATLISGSPKPLTQMQGIDKSFNLAAFIGYHARRNAMTAILEHTITGLVQELRVNGRVVGETGINAGIAGYFGVPLGLVSGDNVVTREAKELIPTVEVVQVKWAEARYAARCLHPTKARALIKERMKWATENHTRFKPYKVKPPITFEVTFDDTAMAEVASTIPTSERTEPNTVRLTHDDYLVAFKGVRAMLRLAQTLVRQG